MAEDRNVAAKAESRPLEPATGRRKGRQPKAEPQKITVGMVESAWQGLWLVLRLGLGLFGFESDVKVLPAEEARADARDLLPFVEHHATLARILSWIGAPVVIAQRVLQHFRRKGPKDKEIKADARPARTA